VSPSPSGAALAWSRVVAEPSEGMPAAAEVVVRDATGDVRTVADAAAYRTPPAWSPDGRTLAYVGDAGIFTVGEGDGPTRTVACRPPSCMGLGAPTWSPGGDAIAFGWLGASGDGLAVLDLSDREPQIVADVVVDGQPSWSPDGSSIALASSDRIVVVDAQHGDVTSSTAFPGRLGDRVSWSPDGRTFVVDGSSGGDTGVFAVPVEGGDPTLLSSCDDDGCTDLDPTWTADGTHVVFTRAWCDLPGGDCFTGDLYVVPADGGDAEPLVATPDLDCCAASRSSVVP
jgi:Tol biopolymer transport system component